MGEFGRKYPACDHIKKSYISAVLNEEMITAIVNDAAVTPLFEAETFQYKHKKNNSIIRNELLRCRWKEYVNKMVGAKKIPFRFPSVHDYHFCKGDVRYEPKETTSNRLDNRYHLRVGPGVDKFGQMPIPDNMQLRREDVTSKTRVSPSKKVIQHKKRK